MKSVADYGTLGTANDAPVFQAALDDARANKFGLTVPNGTFNLGAPLNYITTDTNQFTPGITLVGEGAEKTILNNTHGGIDLVIGTNAASKFQRHGLIEGITFAGLGTGPKLTNVYHQQLHGLHIRDKTNHGLYIPTLLGDPDACNMVSLDQVNISNCKKWGIFGEVAAGRNELSFLSLRNVFIQDCGEVASGLGGGMYWRGQQLGMDEVAFVRNANRGLYIEGGAGLGSDVSGRNVTFENNLSIHLQCYGIKGMVFDALQLYSNDQYKTSYGIRVDAQSSVATNILVRSGTVRATPGNTPHTAFLAFGANQSNCKAQNITWDNYDHPGQTRLNGFTA